MINLSLFFVFIAFALSALSVFYIIVDGWSRFWIKIDGELISSNIAEYKSQLASGEISYRLFVNYKYVYKEKTYFSNRLNISNKIGSADVDELKKLLNDLSNEEKKSISVYVCESAPFLSVLFPGSLNVKLYVFLGVFGASIGLIMIQFST